MFIERIAKLQALLSTWESNALLIESPVDLFYLTGLRLSAGRLYIITDNAQLFVDGRYLAIAKKNSPIPVATLEQSVQKQWLAKEGVHRLAFDSATMSYDQYLKCEALLSNERGALVGISSPLKSARAIKSKNECDKMRQSAALAKEGVRYLYNLLAPGISEKKLAWEFEKFCRERGAERMAFDPIIAFAENTSFPHHRSSDRLWQQDEPVLIDVGCVLDSYASDVTRTLWNKKVPAEFSRIHEIVVRAQKAAVALCYPGTRIGDLDVAARQVMREEGVEELFVHSLGHGIGLETHEYPRVSYKGDDRDLLLEEGMAITIEPGLYAAGICGARHEDTIIVKNDGPENLYYDLGTNFHV